MIGKYFNSLKFQLFIGRRYINSKKNNKKPNVIFLSLFAGIALGLTVLIVVLGIMNGFQENHISRMIEIGSFHASISRKDMKPMEPVETGLIKSKLYGLDYIEAAVPYSDKEVIIKINKRDFSGEQIIKLRAIDPDEIKKDRHFAKYFKIKSGTFDLSENSILLGDALSYKVTGKIGVPVFLTPDIGINSFKNEGIPFVIKGYFYTGSYDYDRYWCFISSGALKNLSGKVYADNIGIKFKDQGKADRLTKSISKILGNGYLVQSAEEINRGFFAALKIEKAMILFIFGMIFLMIATNTFGALKLTLIEKKKDISILKAIGAQRRDIQIIFLVESLFIGFAGCFTGSMLGFFIVYNVTNFFKITEFVINSVLSYVSYVLEFVIPGINFIPVTLYDSSIYYQSEFLVKLDFSEIITISLVVIVMTVLAAFLPVNRASKLKPNEIIKN
jgi:lipoprotein-releasing system permease protein